MRLHLPESIAERLTLALMGAGEQEIGGVLMGEHVGLDEFRVVDLTIQRRGGSVAWFVRSVGSAVKALRRFFRVTGENYKRFNYLGEWHSHPQFLPHPSSRDDQTMLEILADPKVGANFVVLLVVRLAERRLVCTATIYSDGRSKQAEFVWFPDVNAGPPPDSR